MVQGAATGQVSYDARVDDYDEFAYLDENLSEWGLTRATPRLTQRASATTRTGTGTRMTGAIAV